MAGHRLSWAAMAAQFISVFRGLGLLAGGAYVAIGTFGAAIPPSPDGSVGHAVG